MAIVELSANVVLFEEDSILQLPGSSRPDKVLEGPSTRTTTIALVLLVVLEVLIATGGTSHLEVFSGTLSRFSETFLAETVLFCFLSRRHAVPSKHKTSYFNSPLWLTV